MCAKMSKIIENCRKNRSPRNRSAPRRAIIMKSGPTRFAPPTQGHLLRLGSQEVNNRVLRWVGGEAAAALRFDRRSLREQSVGELQ